MPQPAPNNATPWWKPSIVGPVVVGLILLVAAGFVTGVFGGGDKPVSDSSGASRPPARVLLLIDVSRSMECPLAVEECDENLILAEQLLPKPRRTRIEAVRALVAPRLDTLDHDGDRIGLWLFTSSDEGLPDECDRQGLPCKLRSLGYSKPGVRAILKTQIGELLTNYGGTPLYKAIALGIRELRKRRSPLNAVKSLVVITDGFDHTDDDENMSRTELVDIANEGGEPVQVLMTAAGQQICDDELEPTVLELFGGTCEDAQTGTELQEAGDNIVDALRVPPDRPAGSDGV